MMFRVLGVPGRVVSVTVVRIRQMDMAMVLSVFSGGVFSGRVFSGRVFCSR